MCKARVKVDVAGRATDLTNHDHTPDPEGIVATEAVAHMRHRGVTTVEKPGR